MITEIQTPHGSIEIHEPTIEMIRRLQTLLPYGMMILEEPIDGAKYCMAMQCEEEQMYCIRLKPLECEYDWAVRLFNIHHYLIMHSYCEYINKGLSGAYLATSYLKQRQNKLWEAGVANFIFPEVDVPESNTTLWKKIFSKEQAWDDQFGKGATKMLESFMESFKTEYPYLGVIDKLFGKYISFGARHSQPYGGAMWYMVLDSEIICIRPDLFEQEDKAWGYLASEGIKKVYHLPSIQMGIDESDLAEAKGRAEQITQKNYPLKSYRSSDVNTWRYRVREVTEHNKLGDIVLQEHLIGNTMESGVKLPVTQQEKVVLIEDEGLKLKYAKILDDYLRSQKWVWMY